LICQLVDDCEVVRHIDEGGSALARELSHQLEHTRLSSDVQPCRRLVENDDARFASQRHRNRDTLLLTPRQFEGIAPQEALLRRKSNPVDEFAHGSFSNGGFRTMNDQRLRDLIAHPVPWIQTRGWILRHVGDGYAANSAPGNLRKR
jgi:hypothetical protein